MARELAARHPELGPEEIAAKVRAELGRVPSADQAQLIDAVVARLPAQDAAPAPSPEKPVSAWILVAANLVPLAGVLFWGWDVFPLLLLFWMENVVIGALNVLKMLLVDPQDAALWAGKLFMVPFFCVHYGMFTAGHGALLLTLFDKQEKYHVRGLDVLEPAAAAARDYGLWLPLAVLGASHGFSLLWNYIGRGEFRSAKLNQVMIQPYGRILALHVALLAGGFAAAALGSPVWALLLLLALKIGLDFPAHVKEHSPKAA